MKLSLRLRRYPIVISRIVSYRIKQLILVDEACATLRVEMESMPQELDELQRKIMQLQIEETSLKQEEDKKAIERREEIERELAELQCKA